MKPTKANITRILKTAGQTPSPQKFGYYGGWEYYRLPIGYLAIQYECRIEERKDERRVQREKLQLIGKILKAARIESTLATPEESTFPVLVIGEMPAGYTAVQEATA